MIRRILTVVGGTLLGMLWSPGDYLSAHELERTTVFVSFDDDGSYLIDVVNDPDWLLARVEPFSGRPSSGRLEPVRRDEILSELVATFSDGVSVYFDDERVDVVATYIPPEPDVGSDSDTLPVGTMRLEGRVPEGSRSFRWAYSYVIDPYPMLIEAEDGEWITSWVNGDQPSEAFEMALLVPMTRSQVVGTYLGLGYTHILPKGLDHILFVVGIFLLSARVRPIVMQVTTFTLAHTVTLGLTIYGVLSLPPTIVEPLIALSIAYVAVENLVTTELKPWRIVLVFAFGLLHGMGFAGVLTELGLPRSEFVAALVSFNLGVEVGQLTVIAGMFLAVGWFRDREWYRRWAVVPLSLAIAVVGLYWTVTRLMGG